MGHKNKIRGPNETMGHEYFRRPNTTWATEIKFAAQMRLWATSIFVAQVLFGRRILFRRQKTQPWTSLLYFRRPNFGLRLSDVENIFAAQCLGRRKCNIGRRYHPWPKTLFLAVKGWVIVGLGPIMSYTLPKIENLSFNGGATLILH